MKATSELVLPARSLYAPSWMVKVIKPFSGSTTSTRNDEPGLVPVRESVSTTPPAPPTLSPSASFMYTSSSQRIWTAMGCVFQSASMTIVATGGSGS